MSLVEKMRAARAAESPEKNAKRGTSRVSVIAKWPDIREALDAGFDLKAIWQTLKDSGEMPVGYDSFRIAVKQQLARLADAEAAIRAAASAPPSPGAQGSGQPRSGPRMGRAPDDLEVKPFRPKPLEEMV